ncbi:hypothetical protein LXT21_29565 [Myxococcus sp. K38C18041901]|uniref:hypothetical protein n=1 Tax=Myxococcus guangdongensis TaxID=2906760 RepID=UPI0020A715E9|nr:hypothetical protein [Myxococcus guangdongensis]MCP3062940.1 hypothetical protein [Myxococcus guangdongensis]
MAERICGLTLWRPWGWAIFHAGKDVENRGAKFPAPPVDSWLAIHNGLKWDEDNAEAMAEEFGLVVPPECEHPAGAIIGVARVEAVTRGTKHRESRWYMGDTGLWLADATPITPVPCRGSQGLWTLREDVLVRVRDEMRRARRVPGAVDDRRLVALGGLSDDSTLIAKCKACGNAAMVPVSSATLNEALQQGQAGVPECAMECAYCGGKATVRGARFVEHAFAFDDAIRSFWRARLRDERAKVERLKEGRW